MPNSRHKKTNAYGVDDIRLRVRGFDASKWIVGNRKGCVNAILHLKAKNYSIGLVSYCKLEVDMVVFSTNCLSAGRCRTLLRAAFVFLVLPPSPSMALTCTEVEFVAKYSMMLYRQGGQPLSAAIERFYVGEKEDADLYKKIVIDAYDQPLFTSEEYKNKESIEFSNKWYSACIKSGLEN